MIAIESAATHDLRRRVLRVGTVSTAVEFPDDDSDRTVHLGVELDGAVVAISTWTMRPPPDHPEIRAVQLRGMATEPSHELRGRGLGTLLLRTGIERARAEGADLVWANARTTALGFYEMHGFTVEGPEFVTADTGLPHRRIHLRL